MRPEPAARLARRLGNAWPTQATDGWMRLVVERLVGWDDDPAITAVEQMIDTSRFLPSVADLRDAYSAAGGRLPDLGRDMSPPVQRGQEDPAEPAEVASLLEARRRARMAPAQRGQTVLPSSSSKRAGGQDAPAVP